jgi:outer membrane protein assembly factor BamB
MRRAMFFVCMFAFVLAGCDSPSTINARSPTPSLTPMQGDWLEFGFDGQHDMVNPGEKQLSAANVNGLHRVWAQQLPDVADSTPVFAGSVSLPNGKNGAVMYLTTLHGTLLAVDAVTGAILWQKPTHGPKITNSSPAIDPSGRFVYSYGLDGKVHKYAAGTGDEVTGNGWPLTTSLMTEVEKESSALTIVNGRLYVTMGGYIGDQGHYEGHVLSIPLAGGTPSLWNSPCSNVTQLLGPTSGQPNYCPDVQSAIWARAGTIADPATNVVYVVTGNGTFKQDSPGAGPDWGDTVIALKPDLSQVVDSFTPTNYVQLDDTDADLGSTAPALLPRLTNNSTPLVAVQGGKDGVLRLLNRQNLSGQGGPGHVGGQIATVPQPGSCQQMLTQPAVWTDASGGIWVLVTNYCAIAGYQVVTSGSGVTLHKAWQINKGATSPIIANGVEYVVSGSGLLALDPTTGHQLWSSAQSSAGGNVGSIHWESPIVIAGHLYVTDQNGGLYAYGL